MNKYIRYCPKCNKKLIYKYRQSHWLANKKNTFCKRCSDDTKKGKPLSDITKQKLSKALSGEKNPFYGKHHTIDTKLKLSN